MSPLFLSTHKARVVMQTQFDAVLLAGFDPTQPDPVAQAEQVPNKVLIEVGGQPMIWHVVRALAASTQIRRIVIVGLAAEDAPEFGYPVHYLPNQASLLDNAIHGLAWLAESSSPQHYALLLTGDIPLLTTEMVDWFLAACQPLVEDVYWGIVEQRQMETTFPESQRSYLPVVEGRFCNGSLFLGKIEAALSQQGLLQQLVAQRKNIFQQLWLLGPGVIGKFLLRRLRLADLLGVVERLLHLRGHPIVLPFAESGMDVDKPHQLAQVRAAFAQRSSPEATG